MFKSATTTKKSDNLYIDLSGASVPRRIDDETVNETMKKAVIRDNFEQLSELPSYRTSKWQSKKKRAEERARTKGPGWFDMRAPEMDESMANSLRVLAMRHALEPKRFYKRYERNTLPKFAQLGTVVESKADFYASRIPKRQRRANLVEELLADAEFKRTAKRRYGEIVKKRVAIETRKRRIAQRAKAKQNKSSEASTSGQQKGNRKAAKKRNN